jgi:hypothetical protein
VRSSPCRRPLSVEPARLYPHAHSPSRHPIYSSLICVLSYFLSLFHTFASADLKAAISRLCRSSITVYIPALSRNTYSLSLSLSFPLFIECMHE